MIYISNTDPTRTAGGSEVDQNVIQIASSADIPFMQAGRFQQPAEWAARSEGWGKLVAEALAAEAREVRVKYRAFPLPKVICFWCSGRHPANLLTDNVHLHQDRT